MRQVLLALLMLGATSPALAAAGPVEVVQDTTDRLYSVIEGNRAKYEANPGELQECVRDILLPKLDELFAGRLVLGRHARGLAPKKVEAFAQSLSNLLIEKYAEQLLEFKSRDQMEVLPLSGEADERKTRVQTRVKLTTGQSVPVDYVMHKTDEGWQVFDVVVEGVSYVVTFRTQFNEEISRHGFDKVMERIRQGKIEVATGDD